MTIDLKTLIAQIKNILAKLYSFSLSVAQFFYGWVVIIVQCAVFNDSSLLPQLDIKSLPATSTRFWSFQIIFVATPSVIYIVYSGHSSKLKKAQSKRPRPSHIEEADDGDDDGEEQHQEVHQDKHHHGNITAGLVTFYQWT